MKYCQHLDLSQPFTLLESTDIWIFNIVQQLFRDEFPQGLGQQAGLSPIHRVFCGDHCDTTPRRAVGGSLLLQTVGFHYMHETEIGNAHI